MKNADSIIDRIHELAFQGRLKEAETLAMQLRANANFTHPTPTAATR
jgi:hypothetical protein